MCDTGLEYKTAADLPSHEGTGAPYYGWGNGACPDTHDKVECLCCNVAAWHNGPRGVMSCADDPPDTFSAPVDSHGGEVHPGLLAEQGASTVTVTAA